MYMYYIYDKFFSRIYNMAPTTTTTTAAATEPSSASTTTELENKTKQKTVNPFKNCCRLFHWGPCLALTIIFLISFMSLTCTLIWWPISTAGGLLNLSIFIIWDILTLYNYFMAVINGPGYVPHGWKPKVAGEEKFLQYCVECKGHKAPRSHHCRKCKRCVMKMDHHCPWINTCCGYLNHANFIYFLFFAPCGCIHGAFILIGSLIQLLNNPYYLYHMNGEPMVQLSILGFIIVVFSIGLAVGVIVAVGMLFCIQFHEVLKNETAIESWIIEKAKSRERDPSESEFIYPYNLGWKNNLKLVFWSTDEIKSNGITWPVIDSCNQYTLTVEQLIQKAQKKERVVLLDIVQNYSGYWFPFSKGCRVVYNIPCSDEARIPLSVGDVVEVSRGRRYWLYGTKVNKEDTDQPRVRGWFPRCCARERNTKEMSQDIKSEIEDENEKKKN
ncbi:palmitoyltransferase ZDHHC6 [Octopus bimaculoides]|uniref:Palmitoyltransferase n=1 Tax=Octopus bimaculoides TaxID=37653 RepID=A0A0L8HJ71_OCTBM|nr:palmitoyltransferase ZDHHC6 [Octopus bimaculoides]|eukprot:XP_014772182.1 PREDICTED: palmitoyltransferase ZDHHC6-like [Octopus bimaculoides]